METADGPTAGWAPLKVLEEKLSLGDVRVDRRILTMARDCLSAGRSSVSGMFGAGGKLKASTALLSNERAALGDLRDGLYQLTLSQMHPGQTVIVAYDPTLLDFSGHNRKLDRTRIGDGRGRGYIWHNAAAIDFSERTLMGPLYQGLVAKDGPDDASTIDYAPGVKDQRLRSKLERNEKQQFLIQAQRVDRLVPPEIELRHVADREFDDGLALRALGKLSERSKFVIRGMDNRAIQVHAAHWLPKNRERPSPQGRLPAPPEEEQGLEDAYLHDVVRSLPLQRYKTLPLDDRNRRCPAGAQPARLAKLSIGAVSIRLARQSKRGQWAHLPEDPIWLNLVVVRELHPPKGVKPLQWLLLTDLPVSTLEEQAEVAETYGCRWRIEEFFRTTNDALHVEESKLDDAESTARLLFFVTLKAIFLDSLRTQAGIPAGVPPTTEQRQEMKRGAVQAKQIEQDRQKGVEPPPLSAQARARMALGLLAEHGRWTGKSGAHLGNYVLLWGLPILIHDLSEGRYRWLFDDALPPRAQRDRPTQGDPPPTQPAGLGEVGY